MSIIRCLQISALLTILLSHAASAQAPAATSPDVEELLRQIRLTLIKVQGTIDKQKLPALKSVTLNLKTAVKISGGGKIVFFIIEVGPTISKERVQTIEVRLTPPKPTEKEVAAVPDFSQKFADAIVAVAETIYKSSAGKPPLNLTSLSANVKFVSETKMEGGLKKIELLPVTVDLSGSVNETNTHEATLQFGDKPKND